MGGRITHLKEGWRDDSIVFGMEHIVYACGIFASEPKVLIDPQNLCRPNWYSLFDMEVTDSSLPTGWELSCTGEAQLSLLIGYSLLLHSESHFDGILERNKLELA